MGEAPIWNMLEQYKALGRRSFAMPGHKGGRGFSNAVLRDFGAYDVTELAQTDSLHAPQTAILEALEQARAFYGTDKTYFLTNGSTSGIHMMLSAACRRGGKVLVDRGCHGAAMNGCVLFGLEPVYVRQGLSESFFIPQPITPEQVFDALQQNEVQAVVVTSPNYYGLCADIEGIAKVCHGFGVPLLVDEAHGAHFAAAPELLPAPAIKMGADMVVQSAHKTLNALNQSAFLHLKSDLIDGARLQKLTAMLLTSSPSYPMVATMDKARAELTDGEPWRRIFKACRDTKVAILEKTKIRVLTPENSEGFSVDETRLVLNFSMYQVTGFDIAEKLLTYGIDVEMADLYNVVCIVTAANTAEDLEVLLDAIVEIEKTLLPRTHEITIMTPPPLAQAMLPTAAFDAGGERLPLESAIGRISKSSVAAYPPGVPLIVCGEEISAEIVEYIKVLDCAGAVITGLENAWIEVVK